MATVDLTATTDDREPRIGPTAESVADALFAAAAQAAAETPLRRPGATYRLQIHKEFRLDDVGRVAAYLADLGVTDCYWSPILEARPGSTHGYDVIDHSRINPEVGDEDAHARLLERLAGLGMGRVLDVVPNHMGVSDGNRAWIDLLETGPQARSALMFDVDWRPVRDELAGRVLLPILEDLYGKVLEAGLLTLERDGGSFWVRYRGHRLPLDPRSYARVLDRRSEEFHELFEPDDDDVLEYRSLVYASRNLPPRTEPGAKVVQQVRREKEVVKRRLRRLCAESPRFRTFLDGNVASFQGTAGDPASFDALHELLEGQVYRLAYWRVAAEEINYRRFFDVTELAGIRVEDARVFDWTHERIVRWVVAGGVVGLRIDHPDGLADPLGYFRRLQEQLFLHSCESRLRELGTGRAWTDVVGPLRARYQAAVADDPTGPLARRFPIVVEKILSRGESLPTDWPIDGTVGYEFLNALNGLFVDPSGVDALTATYREFTGDDESFVEVVHESKLSIEDTLLASELTMLTRQLVRVAEHGRLSRDFTHNDLRRALREVIACFPMYRTYVRPGAALAARDRDAIDQAVARARSRRRTLDESIFAFVREVLTLNIPERLGPDDRALWESFATRFQQTTGPVQAKGLEDTAFYRQYPLLALNEVGGDPTRSSSSPSVFHALNSQRLARWPGGLSTTATHDTKRGEDARLRIDVLSEWPDEWRTHLARWSRWNARKKIDRQGVAVPDAREEYLLYQSLIGAWPFEGPADAPPPGLVARVQNYLVKAACEAKRNTSWTDPDPSYAESLRLFVALILEGADAFPFLNDFLPFQRQVARVGVAQALAQTLLKLTAPGVPDIYQGGELWDFSLVDPDNRSPVDYDLRARLLAEIRDALASGTPRATLAGRLFDHPENGAIKLYLIGTILNERKREPALYQQGSYRPIEAVGERSEHVVSFQRQYEGRSVVIVAPRLLARLMGPEAATPPLGDAWGDTRLTLPDAPAGASWRNLLTDRPHRPDPDRTIPLAAVFAVVPCALLTLELTSP